MFKIACENLWENKSCEEQLAIVSIRVACLVPSTYMQSIYSMLVGVVNYCIFHDLGF